jgi:PAS domain S-box-containing protein
MPSPRVPRPAQRRAPGRGAERAVAEERAFRAERTLAGLRLLVIASGTVIYPLLLDHAGTVEWLAYLLLGLAWAYGLLVWLAEPYRRAPVMMTSAYTAVNDAVFTMLWLYATGGYASPFYVALYGAAAAVAYRFSLRATVGASVLYAASYLALLEATGSLQPHLGEVAVRTVYILLVGAIAGSLSHEARAQTMAKLRLGAVVHDLARSEARIRGIIDAAPDAIVIRDRGGRVVLVNSRAEEMFGYGHGEMLGLTVEALLHDRHRPALLAHRGKPRGSGVELQGLRKDGSELPVELSWSPIDTEEGLLVTNVIRDISERKRVEVERLANVERIKELERLKELDRFKTQFINNAAHELGTPLTPIKLQLHVLKSSRQGGLSPQQQKALAILDRNVDRMAALVADVLQVARLQSGKLGIERQPMDLHRVVAEAVESFQEPAEQAGLSLELRTTPGLTLQADAKRVTQVLFNLLNNAWKFTPPGGAITVETRREGGEAVVRVRDTGAGLRPEDIPRLFRPFTQVHDTMERTRGGTGLGLYICRGIVELHGGRIWAESEGPGRGATFTFTLPLAAPVAEQGRGPPPAAERVVEFEHADRLAQRARELV